MKVSAVTNDSFHLLTLGAWRIHATALPMGAAMRWAEQANAAKQAIESALDYAEMTEAVENGAALLREYPNLQEGRSNPVPEAAWEHLTTEQVMQGLEGLLEVNDPFVSVRRKRQADEERGMQMLAMMPESERATILHKHFASSDASSMLTPGESSSGGRSRSGSKP